MTTNSYLWMTALVALIILFPEDSQNFAEFIYLEFRVSWLNVRLFMMEWKMYRALIRISKEIGIDPPPFNFVPIQKRGSAWPDSDKAGPPEA